MCSLRYRLCFLWLAARRSEAGLQFTQVPFRGSHTLRRAGARFAKAVLVAPGGGPLRRGLLLATWSFTSQRASFTTKRDTRYLSGLSGSGVLSLGLESLESLDSLASSLLPVAAVAGAPTAGLDHFWIFSASSFAAGVGSTEEPVRISATVSFFAVVVLVVTAVRKDAAGFDGCAAEKAAGVTVNQNRSIIGL